MKKNEIIKSLSKFHKANVLCIGDIMLDIFIEGSVERISPEAPVPVLLTESLHYQIGGAGNVARNMGALGSKVSILSLLGMDEASKQISQILKKEKKIYPILLKFKKYKLPTKTRFLSKSNQLLRVDEENNFIIDKELEKKLYNLFKKKSKLFKTVVISNYKKGVLSKNLVKKIISYCNDKQISVLVDPKYRDFSVYKGATIITPNQKEFSKAVNKDMHSISQIVKEGQKLINAFKFTNVLVTRSDKGMILISKNKFKNFSVTAQEVFDVTGAGDTVIGSLAIGADVGLNINDSVQIANYAAGIVVEKKGTAVASKAEITAKIK